MISGNPSQTTKLTNLSSPHNQSNYTYKNTTHLTQINHSNARTFKKKQHLQYKKMAPISVPQEISDGTLQERSFQQNWNYFILETNNHFKFQMQLPVAISQEGQKMLKDGYFLVWWLRTLETSKFINIKSICNLAYKKFNEKLEKGHRVFECYHQSLRMRKESEMELEKESDEKVLKRDFQKRNSESGVMGRMEQDKEDLRRQISYNERMISEEEEQQSYLSEKYQQKTSSHFKSVYSFQRPQPL